ncbi:hypothetical protein LIA77_09307 [Sarocladium implicatum]|nr:hypothetical protein LIA77_09307 [Sarocladium implicatum]
MGTTTVAGAHQLHMLAHSPKSTSPSSPPICGLEAFTFSVVRASPSLANPQAFFFSSPLPFRQNPHHRLKETCHCSRAKLY